jgi:hypothetical protein
LAAYPAKSQTGKSCLGQSTPFSRPIAKQSFGLRCRISSRTAGAACDFATGDGGGDLISLAAYLFDLRQDEAALKVAEMLGVNPYDR